MQPSFGSGSNLLGAPASAVMGMPHGLQQQSPASAGYTPGMLPSTQSPQAPSQNLPQAPQMQSMGAPGPVSQPMPQAPQNPVGTPPGVPETQMILKALISRLALQGDHEKTVRDNLFPQPQGI